MFRCTAPVATRLAPLSGHDKGSDTARRARGRLRSAKREARARYRRRSPPPSSHQLEIGRGALAVFPDLGFETDCLSLPKARQAATFDSRDMHEHIRPAIITCNKSVSLLGVEPLHCSCSHKILPAELTVAEALHESDFPARTCCRVEGPPRRPCRGHCGPIACLCAEPRDPGAVRATAGGLLADIAGRSSRPVLRCAAPRVASLRSAFSHR
jgi:hypothetical protein